MDETLERYLKGRWMMVSPVVAVKNYSGYTRAHGVAGRTIEAIGHVHSTDGLTVLLFTDGTFMVCQTWCE